MKTFYIKEGLEEYSLDGSKPMREVQGEDLDSVFLRELAQDENYSEDGLADYTEEWVEIEDGVLSFTDDFGKHMYVGEDKAAVQEVYNIDKHALTLIEST